MAKKPPSHKGFQSRNETAKASDQEIDVSRIDHASDQPDGKETVDRTEAFIPISEKEIQVIETFLADLLDELLGSVNKKQKR